MVNLTKSDLFEAIAGFLAWIVISNILSQYLNLSKINEGALIWAIAWLTQKVIQRLLEENITPHDASDKQFLRGKGLETLREIYCRTNPQDEVCSHYQKYHKSEHDSK